MTELSPAAHAVLDAFRSRHTGQGCLAAALRAAADQVVPTFWHEEGDVYAETIHDVRCQLLAIADELEAQ